MKKLNFCYEIATLNTSFRNILDSFYSETELLLSDLKALKVEAERMYKYDVRISIYSVNDVNIEIHSSMEHYENLTLIGYLDSNKNEIHYI